MSRFFNGVGYTADIPALRQAYSGLLTLEQFLRQNGWENATPVQGPQGAAAYGRIVLVCPGEFHVAKSFELMTCGLKVPIVGP